jgi:glycosyltransferase involved in cell wall biosynthesis
MAYELPCVATDIEGHNDLIVDGESGVLTPPGSAEALVDRMSYLLEHEAERRRLGKNARERVERFFDMDTNMERIIDLALK